MAAAPTPRREANGTWLASSEHCALTPHRNPARRGQPWALDVVVVHFTATPWSARFPEQAGSDRARQLAWLRGEGRESSTHLDILRDGELLQGAPLEDRTWHCGGSVWVSPEGVQRTDVNRRAIGLDLDNVGRLYELAGGVLVDSYERARIYTAPGAKAPDYRRPAAHAVRSPFGGPAWQAPDGTWWEAYRAAQVRTLLQVVVALRGLFPRLADPRRWVGHEHIRSTKSDPGPAFPWPFLQAALQPSFTADSIGAIDWSAVPGVAP